MSAVKNGKESGELLIYSEIDSSGYWGVSANDVVAALDTLKGVATLEVRINSGGGDVFDGIAIYEAIKRFPAKTRVYVDGLAASAASVIAMAGDERFVSKAGFFMIHKASGVVFGDDEDMRKMADILENISDQIAHIYEDKTSLSFDQLRDMIAAETWINADDAVEHGFATDIIDDDQSVDVSAHIGRLKNAQNAFEHSLKAKAQEPPPDKAEKSPATDELTDPANSRGFLLTKIQNEKESPMSREALLRERIENATIAMEQIEKGADERGDDLTSAEVAQIKEFSNEIGEVQSQLDAVLAVKNAKSFLNSPQSEVKPATPSSDKPKTGQYASNTTQFSGSMRKDGKFTNGLGEFAKVIMANMTRGVQDQRLDAIRNAETNFGSGGEGPSGGYAVPDDFRDDILNNSLQQDPLISAARQIPTSSRSVTLSTRETQAWQTGSVTAKTTAEGAAIERSTYAMNQVKIELHKTAALIFASEELLEDAPALANEIITVGSEQINFKVANQMIRGSGANEMTGILNAPALATVAAETQGGAQTADTIVVENINNMYAAMPSRNRSNAIWLLCAECRTANLESGIPRAIWC